MQASVGAVSPCTEQIPPTSRYLHIFLCSAERTVTNQQKTDLLGCFCPPRSWQGGINDLHA